MSDRTPPLFDLHGIEGQPFPGFDEETMFLERVTITDRDVAIREIRCELGFDPDDPEEVDPRPIHMRHIEGEEMLFASEGEFDSGWLECPANHPDAVPFWKETP